MLASELTMEFARKCYADAEMTPISDTYGYYGMCGCLVGAMSVAVDHYREDDIETFFMSEYDLKVTEMNSIVMGFDNGFDGVYEKGAMFVPTYVETTETEDWYSTAFKIGETFRKEKNERK